MTPGRPKGGELSEGDASTRGPREASARESAVPRAREPATARAPEDVLRPQRTNAGARLNASPSLSSDENASDPSATDDLVLVRRAQAGDRAAFRLLFDRYHRRVYAVALSVLKSPQDAHDVVQEAFVKVHRYLPDFQGASSFYTWLYRISMNLSIDQLRRRKTARHVDYDDAVGRGEEGDEGNLTPFMAGGDPGKSHSRKELAAKMQAALSTLPEYHQQVILLREVEGLSYEEIAKIMKVPKGTIMSRLFHARRKMQTALADYVEGELKPQDQDEDRS
ncbi:MAG: polymerase sigma factor RpoE [Myxococcaceae bacterium]|nr:polymerase sigma factor RpoE [Myxococcaceae bacterium]